MWKTFIAVGLMTAGNAANGQTVSANCNSHDRVVVCNTRPTGIDMRVCKGRISIKVRSTGEAPVECSSSTEWWKAKRSQPLDPAHTDQFAEQLQKIQKMLSATKIILSDADLLKYARAPFDKASKMQKHEYIGSHHGELILVDFPCSDVCPDYTKRIIHYDVSASRSECDAVGGVIREEDVPSGIANRTEEFCEPKVLVGSGAVVDK